MSLNEIIEQLTGQTIETILPHSEDNCDCGLTIVTSKGDRLSIGYSGCEGKSFFNKQIIKELE